MWGKLAVANSRVGKLAVANSRVGKLAVGEQRIVVCSKINNCEQFLKSLVQKLF